MPVALKKPASPVTVAKVSAKPVAETKVAPNMIVSDIEEFDDVPSFERGSKYDFKLNELKVKTARWVGLPEGIQLKTFEQALRNAVERERSHRNHKDNFKIRPETRDGIEGFKIFCLSVEEAPLRATHKAKVAA